MDGDRSSISPEEERRLIEAALQVRQHAYAPYSRFAVGAALWSPVGRIYTGCNVENAALPATVCAERTALLKAVSEGERRFAAIAVVADTPGPCSPCGLCRQGLYEFAPNLLVIMANLKGDVHRERLSSLLPAAFGPDQPLWKVVDPT